MFCVSNCIGDNCPWQKESDGPIALSTAPADNRELLDSIYEQFDDAINVIIELATQFEQQAQANLLEHSPTLDTLFSELEHARYLPPCGGIAGVIMTKGDIDLNGTELS